MWRVTRTGSPEVLRVSESSPDSAEASFRELDVVFLQTQTRIWLGEVLHVRFDEDVGITDLLADGELLFQVSKEVWKMLLRKHGELKYSKMHIYERTSSGKSEGRYMPYSKVDSFLKICQILGLTGIDLFSPSDVVEKRDIRKVCMCIRSLSKKARSKNLNVPDFDIVTYTIAMPTHLVGGIRRNLELSWCIPSSFSTSSLWNDAREICGIDNTIFPKDTIMLDECSKNKDRQGRTVGKAKNQVLKSVAGVVTMVGVFVLFLHVSQKKDKEKKNEMGMSFLIQKPNEEFFTKRKIKIGKSDSLYPGEKLKL